MTQAYLKGSRSPEKVAKGIILNDLLKSHNLSTFQQVNLNLLVLDKVNRNYPAIIFIRSFQILKALLIFN